jgi:hypothetical protein
MTSLTVVFMLLFAFNVGDASLLPDVALEHLILQQPHLLHLYAPSLTSAQQIVKRVLTRFSELDRECTQSLQAIQQGWHKRQLWALECAY